MRVGIAFTGAPFSVRQIMNYALEAENAGLDSVWIAEDYYLRDAVSPLASLAISTSRLRLALGVISPLTRNPVLIAQTVATIDEASKGRVILALGTGVLSLIERMGVKVKSPLKIMRESVEIIRLLLRGHEVTFRGEAFNVEKVKLGVNPYFALVGGYKPFRAEVPIYLAAVGPKMLKLAGEIGDGVLLTAGCSQRYVRYAVRRVEAGAREAGRRPEDLEVVCYILYSPKKPKEVNKVVRGFIAFAVAYSSPEILKMDGFTQEESRKIREVLERRGMLEASKIVPEAMIEVRSATGGPERLRERVLGYMDAGVNLPVILAFEPEMGQVIKAVKEAFST